MSFCFRLYIEGSVANKCASPDSGLTTELKEKQVSIEHPSGKLDYSVRTIKADKLKITSVSYIRTARLISSGVVYVPGKPTDEYYEILLLYRQILGAF